MNHTFLVLRFIRMSSFRFLVMGSYNCIHPVFSGCMQLGRAWGYT